MKTVIVANGPIENKGEYIDKCDRVIRMHHSPIDKLKKHVGSKMDIWVIPYGKTQPWMNIPWNRISYADEIWSFNGGNQEFIRVDNLFVVSPLFMDYMATIIPKEKMPSKGFMTLMFALLRYPPPIYIAGFSFYEKPGAWFWDMNPREAPLRGYSIGTEKMYMDKLLSDRIIKWI